MMYTSSSCRRMFKCLCVFNLYVCLSICSCTFLFLVRSQGDEGGGGGGGHFDLGLCRKIVDVQYVYFNMLVSTQKRMCNTLV